jgi:hypothetical protein
MIQAIVTSQKGSWRWQDAYRVSSYQPRVTRDGRVILRSQYRSGKYSWPQLRRVAFFDLPAVVGSLHNARPQITVVDDFGALVGVWHNNQFSAACQ